MIIPTSFLIIITGLLIIIGVLLGLVITAFDILHTHIIKIEMACNGNNNILRELKEK